MTRLAPTHTFAELHPPGTAFVPLSSYADLRFTAQHPWQAETITGNAVSCLGAMPALVHRRTFPEPAADFMDWSGLEPPKDLAFYDDEAEAVIMAKQLVQRPLKLVSFFPPPLELRNESMLLVSPVLYERLNSKANLAQLCPAELLPDRFVFAPPETPPRASPFGHPVVVKGAVDGANGGGLSVRICQSDGEFADSVAAFLPADGFSAVIVERYLPFHTSWCLNYAVLDDAVTYLGAAEQLFAAPGRQSGSLIDPRHLAPAEAIDAGAEICRLAQAIGYRGVCGLDMCVSDRRVYYFDLNFRIAASTCFVLLFEALGTADVGLTADFSFVLPYADALKRVRRFAEDGRFVPTRFYDGTDYPGGQAPQLLTGFVLGSTREAAAETAAAMRAALA